MTHENKNTFFEEAMADALSMREGIASPHNNARAILRDRINWSIKRLDESPSDAIAKREFEYWTGKEADTDREPRDYGNEPPYGYLPGDGIIDPETYAVEYE